MRHFWLAVVFVLTASPGQAQTGFLDQSVTVDGTSYRYQLYVPDGAAPESGWPLIVYLHGITQAGSDGLLPTSDPLLQEVRRNRSRFPTLVLVPQAQPGTRWLFPEMERLVLATIDRTTADYRADGHRIYLVGFSMGATGAYRIAFRWPERFAALVAVSGTVHRTLTGARGPEVMAIDSQYHPFVEAADPFGALADRLKTLPVWLFHSTADERVPADQSQRLQSALQARGAEVRYTEYNEYQHVPTSAAAFGHAELVDWLLQQRRLNASDR